MMLLLANTNTEIKSNFEIRNLESLDFQAQLAMSFSHHSPLKLRPFFMNYSECHTSKEENIGAFFVWYPFTSSSLISHSKQWSAAKWPFFVLVKLDQIINTLEATNRQNRGA